MFNSESLCECDKETKRARIQNLFTDQTRALVYYFIFVHVVQTVRFRPYKEMISVYFNTFNYLFEGV